MGKYEEKFNYALRFTEGKTLEVVEEGSDDDLRQSIYKAVHEGFTGYGDVIKKDQHYRIAIWSMIGAIIESATKIKDNDTYRLSIDVAEELAAIALMHEPETRI